MEKTIITTSKAPAPIGPYNQAILTGNTLYTSGQIAINPVTGDLVLDDITKETTQVMENLKAVLTLNTPHNSLINFWLFVLTTLHLVHYQGFVH